MIARDLILQSVDASPPPRVARLLDRWKPTGKEKVWYPNGKDERAVFLWRYFLRSEEEPIALRRGRGLARVLEEVSIAIHDDELIVGEVGLENMALTQPEDLESAHAFWGKRHAEFLQSLSTREPEAKSAGHGLSCKWHNRDGHAIPNFDQILALGLDGLRNEARAAAAACTEDSPGYAARQCQWQAMTISLDALSAYIRRYSAMARQKAAAEMNPGRRTELCQISAVCDWVAENPPRTFWEALQLVWFVHLGIKMDDGSVGHSFGRFDQYLYPFYKADMENGRLTVDQARELVALFWVKLNRECDDIAHLSLGGQTPLGQDAINDLSLLCLQVDRWVGRKQPNLSTRVHKDTPESYFREVARTMRRGNGNPGMFNDEVIIPGLLDYGFPIEIARNYAQVGCVETYLPGLSAPWTDCFLNLAKCLELALNDGRCMLSNDRLGPATGDPRRFKSFEELFEAYECQVEHALYEMLAAKDSYDAAVSAYAPEPLNSALINDCLQQGLDAAAGGARYLLTGAYGVGLGTTIDSLAAIKSLVYGGLLSMDELLSALADNFTGHGQTLAMCRNRGPKYGNDDDRADQIAIRVIESFGQQTRRYPSPHPQAIHYAMFGSVINHTVMGEKTAASASGRLAGETLSDGGSPSQGCNRNGATATLRSLAKADYRLAPGGAAINLRLSPSDLAGEEGLNRLASLLRTYMALGGEQLQVTVVDPDTLRRALEAPERYQDLSVRVAGFTAYFVTLGPAMQQEILARANAGL